MTVAAAVGPVDLLDRFTVPSELAATGPPEQRGLRRDEVKLMVTFGDEIRHRAFADLATELRPGDLLVVNNSATLPASIVVDQDRALNISTELPGGLRLVEVRRLFGASSLPVDAVGPGTIRLPHGGMAELLDPFPVGAASGRLWIARIETGQPLLDYLEEWGRPIRYRYVDAPYPLEAYQTIFARVPGSAEMPSAARPFTGRIVASIVAAGAMVVPVTLHTGVSSLEAGESPYPEWFHVTRSAAALVNHVRREGGRVIAVGTTVVRALETCVDDRGVVHPARSWTDLVVGPDHQVRAVDGLLTGWHEPESTHLHMLEALAGRTALVHSYAAALDAGYLWHEFGDSHLMIRR